MSTKHRPIVVVGVDGSPDSQKAVEWAEQYAVAVGAQLRLIAAWSWPVSYGQELHVDGCQPEAAADSTLEKAKASLSMADDDIEAHVRKGAAPTILVDASRDASVLVVGRHSYSPIARALLGSVSSYCLQHATCPVAVVQ